MKNKIILIHAATLSDDFPYHPFELTFLAPALEAAGYEVIIIDQRVSPESEWKGILSRNIGDAIWIGFTVITGPQIHFSLKTCEYIRRELSADVPLVWGGWHPTFLPDQTIKNPFVDYIVLGIGEEKIVPMTKAILDGKVPSMEGILTKSTLKMLDSFSTKEQYAEPARMPAYHLLDMNRYKAGKKWVGMITSRGCPFRCGFCTIRQVSYINRPVDGILDEIEYLIRGEGFTRINFADGLFFAQRNRVMKIMDGIEERGLKFEWKGSCRPETFSRWSQGEIERVVDNGLVAVNTGIESGSDRMLKLMQKDAVAKDALDLSELTGKYGIELTMYFLMGLPGETAPDLRASIEHYHRLMERNQKVRLFQNFYQPIPGAPMYDDMIRMGFSPPASLEEWPRRVSYNLELKDIKPLPWLSAAEWDEYFDIYANSPFFADRLHTPYNPEIDESVDAPFLTQAYSKASGKAYYEPACE